MSHSHPLDVRDPLRAKRDAFSLPDGVIYLDGNSLGALPKHVPARLAEVVGHEWGTSLIRAWNAHDWVDLPRRVGDRIATLIGAAPGTVMCGDTTSVNVFKALAAAISLRPDRKIILSDTSNFPTDLYMAQGLRDLLDRGLELNVVAPDQVAGELTEEVAVLMLTEVDYQTGWRHDMASLTKKAHEAGALTMWDLAHSAGAFPVDLTGAEADFAVGCGYKYLNGGPGAPAFIYVAPHHQETIVQPLTGWHGHEAPFAFDLDYRPALGIDRMQIGTAPVISMAALDAALDVFDDVDLKDIRAKSVALCDLFIEKVEASCPQLTLATPRDADQRGSQVSFRFEEGYALMQALIARGVIGDFRAPNIVRFGFTPLYNSFADVESAAGIMAEILKTNAWDTPEFKKRAKVT